MPVDLVFIRHGRSEGNEAREQSKQGDNSAYTERFRARLNREWRLTDLGIAQAQAAGAFIREQISPTFSRYYTSEYLRARETAAHLRLPEARWVQDILLRERSWGRADFVMPESERYERFSAELAARREDPCYWRPPEGESLAEVCLRVQRVLHTLERDCPGGSCVLATHEDVMWAARFLVERLTQEQWRELCSRTTRATRSTTGRSCTTRAAIPRPASAPAGSSGCAPPARGPRLAQGADGAASSRRASRTRTSSVRWRRRSASFRGRRSSLTVRAPTARRR